MKQTDRQRGRNNSIIEVLEPRILYSADPVAGAMDVGGGVDALETLLDDTVSLLEQQTAEQPELVFIDSRTPDYLQLIDSLAEDASRNFSVILIDAQESGLEVISETLSGYQDVAAIHLVSHGEAGEITLGNDVLNTGSLAEQAGILNGWGDALHPGADLLIYGCDLAAGVEGEQLVDALARLSGADVAASDDLTGSRSLGGDWDLEYRSGSVEASIAFNAEGLQSWQGILANTAPVLAGANDLTTINEDPVANSGTLVSALITGQVTDPDPDASGIAVIAVDNTNGSWEYTTNAGGSWSAFGSPSSSAAVLLASDTNTLVRFVPDADWNGTVSNGITFHAWDQSTGTAGGTADLTSGIATLRDEFSNPPSYGTSHGTATWTADWMENDSDGPVDVFTGNFRVIVQSLEIFSETTGDWIYREGDLSGATTATLSFSYDNNLAGAQQVDLQVSSNGGASFTAIDTFSVGDNFGTGTISTDISAYIASNLQVRFYVDNGESANPTKKLTIDDFQIAFDGGPGVGGINAFSTASASSDITVTAVNDLPVGLPTISGTVTEDQTLTVDTSGISDADGLGGFSYQWLRDGSDVGGATGTSYVLGDGDVGTQISVRVSYADGHSTNESVTSVLTAAVANVNDLPVGLPTISGTVTEDQTLIVDTGGISDADGLGGFSYQWLRDGSDIGGATGTSYVLGDDDVGSQISVRVSYADGHSTNESVTSVLTAAVANVNDLPVGLPTISGTVTEDQTLTVDTSGISDADGLGGFSYQWLRDGSDIGGATGTSYVLGDDDVGSQISVRVSYTDGQSTNESVTSVLTAAVANVNDLPVGLPTISGTVTEDQTLTVDTSGISDADGLGGFSYQWLRDGSDIGGATGTSYVLGDDDVGLQISVRVSYADGHSTNESVTSIQTAAVVNVNDLPVGLPTTSGTVTEDQTLTVDTGGISDADGLGGFSYQWLRDGSDIGGATGTGYVLGDGDVGSQISVRVSYADGHSTSESVTSVQTAAVISSPQPTESVPESLPEISDVVSENTEEPEVQAASVQIDELSEESVAEAGETRTEEALVDSNGEQQVPASDILIPEPVDAALLADVLSNEQQELRGDGAGGAGYQFEQQVPLKTLDLKNIEIAEYKTGAAEYVRLQSQVENTAFINSLAEMNRDLDADHEERQQNNTVVHETVIGVTMSLSVGVISWVFKSGSLIASFMSVAPLWKQFDPLPVLGNKQSKTGTQVSGDNGQDIQVENIFNQKGAPADKGDE
ncbi:DUF4347 domain-containing protein [Aliamphritea ceti]|uniref:DUF4347 domain-containing protein n=1 Tax=Aliamphritea ceti TaxID=1524258 RepID=UPI0021C4656E|nr:DUF4347 domain-containing protein [Aliamphritea ceti]